MTDTIQSRLAKISKEVENMQCELAAKTSLPSYHDCLSKLTECFGVPGSPTFDEALDWISKHYILTEKVESKYIYSAWLITALRKVSAKSQGGFAYWSQKLIEELERT